MKMLKKMIAVLLVASFLWNYAIDVTYANEINETRFKSDCNFEQEEETVDSKMLVKNEVTDLRDATSKHFMLENGNYIAIGYSTALHRKNGEIWQEIDNRLNVIEINYLSTEDKTFSFARTTECLKEDENAFLYTYKKDKYLMAVSLFEDDSFNSVCPIVTNHTENKEIEYPISVGSLLSDISAMNNQTTVIYENIYDGIDFEYSIIGNDIKENIILRTLSEKNTLVFKLKMHSLRAKLDENGSIYVCDEESGEIEFMIPAPIVFDANGESTKEIYYELEQISDDTYYMKVAIDEKWMSASERCYPVTIDPTVTSYRVSYDTYIDAEHPNTNYGSSQTAKTYDSCTTLVKVDIPTLPVDATVTYASLYTNYIMSGTTGSCSIRVYEATVDWEEYDHTYSIAHSYPNNGIANDYLSTSFVYSTSGIMSLSITALAKRWYAGENNKGVAIKQYSGPGKVAIYTYEKGSNYCPYIVTGYTMSAVPINTGVYFIRNCSNLEYINPSTSTNAGALNSTMQTLAYTGYETQQWLVTYLHNGYYKITNARSGLALSIAVADSNNVGASLKQIPYAAKETQQWKITSNSNRFVLKTKYSSLSNTNLCIAKASSDRQIVQNVYTNDNDYSDEWVICSFDHAVLLAINDADLARRYEYFDETKQYLEQAVNDKLSVVETSIYSNWSVSTMINHLQSFDVLFIHTHGKQDGIKIANSGQIYLEMNHLNGIDLSNISMAVLMTCETGKYYSAAHIASNNPVNIVEKMVLCGARTVIGFDESTYVSDCIKFAKDMAMELTENQNSVGEALQNIDYSEYIKNMADIAVVGGDANNRIR